MVVQACNHLLDLHTDAWYWQQCQCISLLLLIRPFVTFATREILCLRRDNFVYFLIFSRSTFPACLTSALARLSSAVWGWRCSATASRRRTSPRSTPACTNGCGGTWRGSETGCSKQGGSRGEGVRTRSSECEWWRFSAHYFLSVSRRTDELFKKSHSQITNGQLKFWLETLLIQLVCLFLIKLLPVLWGYSHCKRRGFWWEPRRLPWQRGADVVHRSVGADKPQHRGHLRLV